jgi:mannose-6-phosphate isomerase-like protein (cupin superfamily)
MHDWTGDSEMTTAVSVASAEHYVWGEGCDGWHLLKEPQLSVIRERVPVGKGEVLHLHARAQQFFYILSGRACIEIEERTVELDPGQGVHVPAGLKHRFRNAGETPCEFLVISSPTSRGDRENVG